MKKDVTYKQLIAFINSGHSYLEANKDKENKLCVAIKSVQKQIRKEEIIENYQEKITENNLDKCAVDEKTKAILKDTDGTLKFTVEAQKSVNKFNKDLLNETVEINIRTSPETDALAVDLTDMEKEAFSGIVITEIAD